MQLAKQKLTVDFYYRKSKLSFFVKHKTFTNNYETNLSKFHAFNVKKKLNIEFKICGWTRPLQRVYYTLKSMQKTTSLQKLLNGGGFKSFL